MSRLTIDLTDEQHKHLKAVAALEGKTMRQFAVERLFPAAAGSGISDEDQAWEELKELLNSRIEEAETKGYISKTVTEVFDEVLAQDAAA